MNAKHIDRILRESEVNSTQWSQVYPRREGVGGLVFGSGIAKPYHIHKSTHGQVSMSSIHTFITGFTIRTQNTRSKGGL